MCIRTDSGEAALAVLAALGGLFVHIGLQHVQGHIPQLDTRGVKIGEDVGLGQYLIALIGHRVDLPLGDGEPAAHIVGEGDVGLDRFADGLGLELLELFSKKPLRFPLVPLYRKPGGNP